MILCQLIESFSTFPEGTSLDPLLDFPLADLSGESGRQLDHSVTEEIQDSILNEKTELIEDGDLRNPIVPPMTILEVAMVIFIAGTSHQRT